jgi:hypothetical protein
MLTAAVFHLICLKQSGDKPSPTALLIQQAILSGRCVSMGDSPDTKNSTMPLIAPGQPPILTFRYYEGKTRHRFGNSELMLDDAGH